MAGTTGRDGGAAIRAWSTTAADRIDGPGGSWVRIGFLDGPEGRIFAAVHGTAATPRGLALVCPPPLAEGPRNYRREVQLAAGLAAAGVAAIRFHPVGSGHSSDGPLTLASMTADAGTALAALRAEFGDRPTAVVGTRLAALVAARVAAPVPEAALALWDPVVDGAAYAKEVMRARRLSELASGDHGAATAGADVIDVVGYPVPAALLEEASRHPLAEVEIAARPVLLVEMSRRGVVRPGVEQLAERWRHLGAHVDVEVVAAAESWWFGSTGKGGRLEVEVTATEAVTVTLDFLLELVDSAR